MTKGKTKSAPVNGPEAGASSDDMKQLTHPIGGYDRIAAECAAVLKAHWSKGQR